MVTREFEAAYSLQGGQMRTTIVRERDVSEKKVWDGVEELKSWDWQYGQTPEFENSIVGELPFGRVVGISAQSQSPGSLLTEIRRSH